MSRNYTLDPQAAKEANSGGKRINEPGKYVGVLTAAFYEKNEKGTESVHLMFKSDQGQEVGPLALYTHKGTGEELPSFKTLNALLACVKQRGIEAKPGKVKLWDGTAEVEKSKDVYPALIGKRVGLVLTGEEYENRNGEVKQRLVLSAPYEADTERMADEVLNSTDATALAKYCDWLTKAGRWVKPLMTPKRVGGGGGSTPPVGNDPFPDDDIPFVTCYGSF